MTFNPDDWQEVTKPVKGNRVYVYDENDYGKVIATLSDGYIVQMERDSAEIRVDEGNYRIEFDKRLPMWNTMWSFDNVCDDYWLKEEHGIKKMSECGFRIFKSKEFGYFFGIDGTGYDFYEQRWIPLYKARGLKWHETV